jgi:ubiquinone/menaquinone biosynthesis C-methylase UbiE
VQFLKALRLLGDPTRVRILLLLERQELSVAELQEILGRGQSHISTNLSQLKAAALVEDRRTGKNVLYHLTTGRGPTDKQFGELLPVLRQAEKEIPEAERDGEALQFILAKRRDRMRAYFDNLAGRFGREYLPGRSWQGFAEALLSILPPLIIADLGAGEGTFSQILARKAKHVIAVDNSERMVEFGFNLAQRHGLENIEYRLGDMEAAPIGNEEVDLAFFSQSLHHVLNPERAIREAHRIVRPGGHVIILDLVRHNVEEARELYADVWLGFTELELHGFLKNAGFVNPSTSVVHREAEPPYFETVLAVGEKDGPLN